tara:strand:- start:7467 stop:7940 length:474 start_codon:yes stop_codon:yes gene_type:complete
MVAELSIIVTIVAIIFLLLLLILPKKIGYALAGITLIILGLIPLFDALGYISFTMQDYPILDFMIYFIVVIAGKDLFKEGFKEGSNTGTKNLSSYIKWPSIFLGLFLIAFTSIPKLYKYHVISWTIPNYPPIFDVAVYVISGFFLIIGVFTIFDKPK